MKKVMILMLFPMMAFSQVEYSKEELSAMQSQKSDTLISKSAFSDFFGVADKLLGVAIPNAEDPVRVSKAKIVNSRATNKSLKSIKKLNKAYRDGDIDFATYITLKADELGRSIEDLINEEVLIRSKAIILKNQL